MRLSVPRAIAYGALAVGVLDILDAIIFFGVTRGAPPIRIFQSVAAGLLGRAAFAGGVPTALLGALLHLTVAASIVTVYVLASRRLAILAERPVLYGPAYGIAAFFIMNFVVLPLSATAPPRFSTAIWLNGILGHALLVGLPAAFAARAARRANA